MPVMKRNSHSIDMNIYSGSCILSFVVEAESEEDALEMIDCLDLAHYQISNVEIEDCEKINPDERLADSIYDERKIHEAD